MAVTNTAILLFDAVMLFLSAALYRRGAIGFDGILIPLLALMSSFGPVVAMANLGSTLQNTFAAGNRVLDILEEEPAVKDITGEFPFDFFRSTGGADHLCLWGGNHFVRYFRRYPGTYGGWHSGKKRQRQVHATEASDAFWKFSRAA